MNVKEMIIYTILMLFINGISVRICVKGHIFKREVYAKRDRCGKLHDYIDKTIMQIKSLQLSNEIIPATNIYIDLINTIKDNLKGSVILLYADDNDDLMYKLMKLEFILSVYDIMLPDCIRKKYDDVIKELIADILELIDSGAQKFIPESEV